jgi:hypothetical protein
MLVLLFPFLSCYLLCLAKIFPSWFSFALLAQGGLAMRQYIPELMPLIVEALMDGAAVAKREVAVSTLGQVVQSTGYEILTFFYDFLLVLYDNATRQF